ncbi:MAG: hypothetical protein REH79_02465 [Spiroplasma sp.]|nr:hypothetical protein [Spiroplasma sp.]
MLLNKINELSEIYNKIENTQNKNSIWKINDEIFLALINNNYSVIFIIENIPDRKVLTGKNMRIKLLNQIKIEVENLRFIKPGIVIECLNQEKEIKEAFLFFMTTLINNFEVFRQNAYEEFFKIWQLFERNRKRNENNLKGFLGELLIIDLFLKKYNWNISNFYHKNEYNKWDFEFTNKLSLEVKTTSTEERKHDFAFLQLNNNAEIIVASVKLLLHEKGISLYKFAMNLIKEINNFSFSSQLYSFLFLNKINEWDQGIFFDYDLAFNSIIFYLKSSLPKLFENQKNIPNSITNIRYNITLNNLKEEKIEDIIKLINTNIDKERIFNDLKS